MMHCSKCGKEVPAGALLCEDPAYCGKDGAVMSEAEARAKIEKFLEGRGWDGSYNLEFHEASDPEDSTWAFWTVDEDGDSRPYTSYLHMDGSVECYGL